MLKGRGILGGSDRAGALRRARVASVMPDPMADKIIRKLAAIAKAPPESITVESSLAALGLDSLDLISAVFELEEQCGVSIPDAEFRAYRTVGDVVNSVTRLMEAKLADG
jgi:acyl carrier protein